ncbi:MAG: glycosyltransferase family 4 protein [Patescibacteria group bacterium]
MISTDSNMFDTDSAVRRRQLRVAESWDELHVVVFSCERKPAERAGGNVWIYSTGSVSRWLFVFSAIRLARSLFKNRKITNVTCQDPFLTSFVGVYLRKRFGVRLEIQIHTDIANPNYTYCFGNVVRKYLARHHLPWADSIRVVYFKTRDFLISDWHLSPNIIHVRPVIVDIDRIRFFHPTVDLKKKYPQFSRIVLMASRFEPEKNFELALKAWKLVTLKINNAGLIIVGRGSQFGKIVRLRSRLRLDKSVIIEDWADSNTLISYLKTTDLFLLTSLYEGYSMILSEASVAGCSVVSTDVGGAAESGAHLISYSVDNVSNTIISLFQ